MGKELTVGEYLQSQEAERSKKEQQGDILTINYKLLNFKRECLSFAKGNELSAYLHILLEFNNALQQAKDKSESLIEQIISDSIKETEKELETFLLKYNPSDLLVLIENSDFSTQALEILVKKLLLPNGKTLINKDVEKENFLVVIKRWLAILDACNQVQSAGNSTKKTKALIKFSESRLNHLLSTLNEDEKISLLSKDNHLPEQQKVIVIKKILESSFLFKERIELIKKIGKALSVNKIDILLKAGLLEGWSEILKENKNSSNEQNAAQTEDAKTLVSFFNSKITSHDAKVKILKELSLTDRVELIAISTPKENKLQILELEVDSFLQARRKKIGADLEDDEDQLDKVLENNLEKIKAKKVRMGDGLLDAVQLSTLAMTDLAIAVEHIKEDYDIDFGFFDDERLEEIAEHAFDAAFAGLIVGGIMAMTSAYLRIQQLEKLKALKLNNPDEEKRQKKCLIEILRKISEGKYGNNEKVNTYLRDVIDKRLRGLDLPLEEIEADIFFQKIKFVAFGVLQFTVGIAVGITAIVVGAAIIGSLTPIISAILTVSMFCMVYRFYQKKRDAENTLAELLEDEKFLGNKILEINDQLLTLRQKPEENKNEIKKLEKMKTKLYDEHANLNEEIRCAKNDVAQRTTKFRFYCGMTGLCVLATAFGIAFAITLLPVFAVLATVFAVIATVAVIGYLGFNLVQYLKLTNGRSALEANVQPTVKTQSVPAKEEGGKTGVVKTCLSWFKKSEASPPTPEVSTVRAERMKSEAERKEGKSLMAGPAKPTVPKFSFGKQ